MKADLLYNFLGGAVVGMVALALDYFFLQYFVRTPISIAGGLKFWTVLAYLFVPFVILMTSGAKKA